MDDLYSYFNIPLINATCTSLKIKSYSLTSSNFCQFHCIFPAPSTVKYLTIFQGKFRLPPLTIKKFYAHTQHAIIRTSRRSKNIFLKSKRISFLYIPCTYTITNQKRFHFFQNNLLQNRLFIFRKGYKQ